MLLLTRLFLLLAAAKVPGENGTAARPTIADQGGRKTGGPIVLTTSSAEFQILPSGYIQASLFKGDQKFTLDAPRQPAAICSYKRQEVQLALDFGQAKVQEAPANWAAANTWRSPASAYGPSPAFKRTLSVEVYDDFPGVLLSSAEYKNTGSADFRIDRVVEQQHRFSASMVDPKAQPYDMWSFHGSSYDWGKDDVIKLSRTSRSRTDGSSRQRRLRWRDSGRCVLDGIGWRSYRSRRDPALTLSLPVKVEADGSKRVTSPQNSAQARRKLFHAAQFCRGLCGRFLRAAADSGPASCRKKAGKFPSLPRSLQR